MLEDHLKLVAPELAGALEFMPEGDFSGPPSVYRAAFNAQPLPPLPPELREVRCEERFVSGVDGAPDVRVLLYSPPGEAAGPRAALLHIHGGGYIVGKPEMDDASNRATALALGITIVAVAYRLAPETVWPGALQDCYAALAWMHRNAASIGIDPARIGISGQSAGGGHAAALALHVRDKARESGMGPNICFLFLDSPMLDDSTGSGTDAHPYTGRFVWTAQNNRIGWRSLLAAEPGSASVPSAAVPARAQDLSDLPPTFVAVGAIDLFLEEDMEWVRRLTRAGVAAELHVIPGAFHGFSRMEGTPQATQFAELRLSALIRGLSL